MVPDTQSKWSIVDRFGNPIEEKPEIIVCSKMPEEGDFGNRERREELVEAIERGEIDVRVDEGGEKIPWFTVLGLTQAGLFTQLANNPGTINDKVFRTLGLLTFGNYAEYIEGSVEEISKQKNRLSHKELDDIFIKLGDFYERYLINNQPARIDFLEKVYFNCRHMSFSIPDPFFQYLVRDIGDEDKYVRRYAMQLLLLERDRISFSDAEKIIQSLEEYNMIASDLAHSLFSRFPNLRDQVRDKNLPLNEVDPYREIPQTKIGIELEFKLRGEDQEQRDFMESIVEKYRDILYINEDRLLWQDWDVAEVAFGGKFGMNITRDFEERVRSFIREVEKHPSFIAWRSIHIHVDAIDNISIDNSLFYFNDFNEDEKGFETKEVPLASPGKVNTHDYILEATTLFDQVRVLGLMYQNEITQEAIDFFLEGLISGQDRQEIAYKVLSSYVDENSPEFNSLYRLYQKRAIPRLNDLSFIERIDTLPGTVEVIKASTELKYEALTIYAEKITRDNSFDKNFEEVTKDLPLQKAIVLQVVFYPERSIPGTVEVVEEIAGLDIDIQADIIRRINTLPGTVEMVEAITELDFDVQAPALEKINTLPGTVETVEVITELDFDAQVPALEKIDTLPGTVEMVRVITRLYSAAQVSALEKIDTLPGTVEMVKIITELDGLVQVDALEKIDTLPRTEEMADAIADLVFDAQAVANKKLNGGGEK